MRNDTSPTSLRHLVCLLGVLLIFWVGSVHAQTNLSSEEKSKLGLRLQPLIEMQKTNGDASSRALAAQPFRDGEGLKRAGEESTYAVFAHTNDADALQETGAAVDSRFSGFVTARATPSELRSMARLETVSQIRAAGRAKLHNDEAAAFVGARPLNNGYVEGTKYTGEGVIGCVIDTGIDYDHPDFVDENGNSRIISIWDQTFDTDGQTPHNRHPGLFPNQGAFDYGTEYHRSEIESGGLQTEDTNGHGTHVAGTVGANGNADSASKYKGMAPGIQFIIVRTDYSSKAAIDGLNFCDTIAEDRGMSMVANKSLGTHLGPHDGTSEWATAIDETVESGNAAGRAVTVSAGNEGRFPIHISNTIASGGSNSFEISVPSYSPEDGTANDRFGANVWFGSDASATATITSPGGVSLTVEPGEMADTTTSGEGAFTIANDTYVENGDRRIQFIASDQAEDNAPSSGTWTVELSNNSSGSITIDGWLWPFKIGQEPSIVYYPNGDTHSTVGIPGTATHAVTVGSFMHRWRWQGADGEVHRRPPSENRSGNISGFSSEGPRRDGTQDAYKPEITAPGQNVISALSQDADVRSSSTVPGGMHQTLQGTSMASPVVAGSIALLLEENPTLTSSEIKSLLTLTADSDGYTGSVPNNHWGYGRLDVLEAMVNLLNPSGSATYSIGAFDFHPNSTYEGYFKLGGDGDGAHAVRFQPSTDSRLSGAYFHLYEAQANFLSDSLVVELRSDAGGAPGAQIGNGVTIAPNELRPGTWNYQSLFNTKVQLTAGTTYYLVFYPSKPDEVLYFMSENYNASGNTLFLSSGTWYEDSNFDLLVRPILTQLVGVNFLPVELATFKAQTSGRSVTLQWETASETGNARFELQKKVSHAQQDQSKEWETFGTVEGAGTTSSPQSYEYTVDKLDYGTHRFRLRQVDLDGAVHHSDSVKAVISPSEALSVETYPNPIETRGSVDIATSTEQEVTVVVYDVLGRRIAKLHSGTVRPGQPASATVDGSALSSGTYFLRVQGENVTKTKRLTVVH